MFLWCIATDLSLVSSSAYDYDLSLYVVLKALSWIRFILLLSPPLLWNIHNRGQHLNCDSVIDFMIIRFLLTFTNGATRASASSFRLVFLHKWLTWSSEFQGEFCFAGINGQIINHCSSCFCRAHDEMTFVTICFHEVVFKPSKVQWWRCL